MSKRVKISLISSVILFIITIVFNLLFPALRISNRTIDIVIVTFVSCLIFYVFVYFSIKSLERKDEKKVNK